MSRKTLILTQERAGYTLGRVVKATEMMSIQDYAHDHIEKVVRDLLMAGGANALTAGFDYTLTSGLGLSIGEGHAIDLAGHSFNTYPAGQPSLVASPQAHPSLPRIDLVYATLVTDQDTDDAPTPYRRLLSESELAAGQSPYPIEDDTVSTTRQNVAVVAVRQGTANASPVAPAAGANEVPLFQVHVGAGQASLSAGNITDVRNRMRSLLQAWAQVDANTTALSAPVLNETIQDMIAAFVQQGTGMILTYNDAGNILTFALDSEFVQDMIAAFLQVAGSTGLSLSYNDVANLLTLAGVAATGSVMGMMPAADKAKLDAATANNTASTLAMRDSSGNVRHNEARVDSGVRYMADNSSRRSAFVREDFYPLIEVNSPVGFHGAAVGVYEEVKRVAAASAPNSSVSPAVVSVNVAPTFDCYIDPADCANVNFKFEAYALHTATQPPVNAANVWGSDLQLWNATDGVQLAVLSWNWLEVAIDANNSKRSTLFTITGSGYKRLVVRARNNTDNGNALFEIWRARLVINPSF